MWWYLEVGPVGRDEVIWLSPDDGISALLRRDTRDALSTTMWGRSQKVAVCKLYSDLELPASTAVRNECLLFKPLSLQYFCHSIQTDKDMPFDN